MLVIMILQLTLGLQVQVAEVENQQTNLSGREKKRLFQAIHLNSTNQYTLKKYNHK